MGTLTAVKALGVVAVSIGISLATASGPADFMFAAAAYVAYKAANPIYKGANAVIKSYFPLTAQKNITGK